MGGSCPSIAGPEPVFVIGSRLLRRGAYPARRQASGSRGIFDREPDSAQPQLFRAAAAFFHPDLESIDSLTDHLRLNRATQALLPGWSILPIRLAGFQGQPSSIEPACEAFSPVQAFQVQIQADRALDDRSVRRPPGRRPPAVQGWLPAPGCPGPTPGGAGPGGWRWRRGRYPECSPRRSAYPETAGLRPTEYPQATHRPRGPAGRRPAWAPCGTGSSRGRSRRLQPEKILEAAPRMASSEPNTPRPQLMQG